MKKVAIINDTRNHSCFGFKSHYGCELVMKNLIKLLNTNHIMPVTLLPIKKNWKKNLNLIPNDIDGIIINGEGTIHDNKRLINSKPNLLSELGPYSKNVLKKPCFLINSSLYNNTELIYNNLKDFTKIFVRESASQKILTSFNIPSEVAPDLSMAYNNNPSGSKRNGSIVTDSVVKKIKIALKNYARKNNFPFLKKTYFNTSLFSNFFKALNSSEEFLKLISAKELVITGRFHTVTMCILTNTPFIALESNTPKISFLLNDVFNSNKRLIHLDNLNNLNLEEYKTWNNYEKDKIKLYQNSALKKNKLMIKEILNYL
ncbi:MAG: polysaccharide pyruvyl transferase family protein [Candidatus Muiribacteriota bacterium]